ncbi:MAG: STAS domain-containing protein [Fibrobacter sp.]|nr:STAS domain-containing protein [Fibrobacter sp.]
MKNKFVTFFSRKPVKSANKRITVNGNMIGHRVNTLETELLENIGNTKSENDITLDLTNVDYIDSRGISLCILMYKECQKKGFDFSIESSSNIYRIFNQINLTRVFPIKKAARPLI